MMSNGIRVHLVLPILVTMSIVALQIMLFFAQHLSVTRIVSRDLNVSTYRENTIFSLGEFV